MRGKFCLLGTKCDNTWSLKPLSFFEMWRHFINYVGNNDSDVNLSHYHYFQSNWWSAYWQYLVIKLTSLSLLYQVLSHWFPTRRFSHACVGRKTGHWRRRGKGNAQLMTIQSSPGHRCREKPRTWTRMALDIDTHHGLSFQVTAKLLL